MVLQECLTVTGQKCEVVTEEECRTVPEPECTTAPSTEYRQQCRTGEIYIVRRHLLDQEM